MDRLSYNALNYGIKFNTYFTISQKRLFPQLELLLLYEPLKLVLWAPDTNKGKHTCINTIL